MTITKAYQLELAACSSEKPQFPGFRTAISGARYYEPTSGRFLSLDPMGHAASMSLYDFANGDPVNRFDPDGRYTGFEAGTANMSVENEAAAFKAVAPLAVGLGVTMATDGLATPILARVLVGRTLTFVGGVVAAGAGDVAYQSTNIGLGQQNGYSLTQTALVAGGGGVLSWGASYIPGAINSLKQFVGIDSKIAVNLGGEGEVAGVINQQGPWALDSGWRSSAEGKTLAQLQAEGHEFVISSNTALPFGDGSISTVITNSVPIDVNAFLGPGIQTAEISRILSAGGMWINNGAEMSLLGDATFDLSNILRRTGVTGLLGTGGCKKN